MGNQCEIDGLVIERKHMRDREQMHDGRMTGLSHVPMELMRSSKRGKRNLKNNRQCMKFLCLWKQG